jgi:prephenate dehydrogenase
MAAERMPAVAVLGLGLIGGSALRGLQGIGWDPDAGVRAAARMA